MTKPGSSQSPLSGALRRLFDIALAGLVLILFAPLMATLTVLILLESGRPILFSQVRLREGGRQFRMYKFRKFAPQADGKGCPLTLDGDPRMTRVGRMLEATKLDELPQLINILRGDMSFVGPRPESLAFADCFEDGYRAVLDHRPGIFGPSQVAFRREGAMYPVGRDPTEFYRRVLFPAKARLDLGYYPGRTLIGDIGWIFGGALAVLGFHRLILAPAIAPAETNEAEPEMMQSSAAGIAHRAPDYRGARRKTQLLQGSP